MCIETNHHEGNNNRPSQWWNHWQQQRDATDSSSRHQDGEYDNDYTSHVPFHGKRFMEVNESEMIFVRPSKKARYGANGSLQRPLPLMRDWSGLSILSYEDELNIRNSLSDDSQESTPRQPEETDDDRLEQPQPKPKPSKTPPPPPKGTTIKKDLIPSSTVTTKVQTTKPPASTSASRKTSNARRASAPACVHTISSGGIKIDKAEEALKKSRRHSVDSVPIASGDDKEVCLGKDFVPGHWDVVCGRGKNWQEHISNRRFRILVANYLHQYFETISRTRKSIVINTIVTTIQNSGGQGFVKKRGKEWYRISTREAREKASHCLRDCLVDPQNEQLKWSPEERLEKLREAQNNVFRSLELMS